MARNDSSSHSDWGRGGNDPQEVLGEELLFRKNPYRGARKLGAGSRHGGGSADENFWMALIQTSFHPSSLVPALTWDHHGSSKTIRKAARIPYLVRDQEGQLALDHLLIGYIEPDTATTATPLGSDWGQNNPDSDVGVLGRLIMVDLYPGRTNPFGKSLPLSTWPNVFDEDPMVYVPGTARTPWKFRGVDSRVEKSVLVSYAANMGGGLVRPGSVLVGYEGSGGW